MADQYACFGIESLGACGYDPNHPASVYFGIGDAVAVLGLIVALQQFVSPFYLFRLEAYRLKLWYCVAPVFLGFGCVIFAAVLPNLPIEHRSFLEYPITWEIFGGLLTAMSYSIIAFFALRPARVHSSTLIYFIRAGAKLLSSATDEDRVRFGNDLLLGPNLERLIKFASAWQRAEWHDTMIEMARLRDSGLPTVIQGRAPPSAFYRFSHRKELEAASRASSFLSLLADPMFCSVLVRRNPWTTAVAIRELGRKRIHDRAANSFVQEIAQHAILNDESIMAREIDYDGFGAAPILSESLFSDWFVVRNYEPFQIFHMYGESVTASRLARYNSAAKRCFEMLVGTGSIWDAQAAFNIGSCYEAIFRGAREVRRGRPKDYNLSIQLNEAVKTAIKTAESAFVKTDQRQYELLFCDDPKAFRSDIVEALVDIVYEAICGISNDFIGIDDPFWHLAIDTFHHAFSSIGDRPDGMNPLEQRLAIKFIKKVGENMQGFYPALTRVLLSCLGPYDQPSRQPNRTAFNILRDAFYLELQRLPELAAQYPEKIADYIPEHVAYDLNSNTLTHTYRGGTTAVTKLSELQIPPVSLIDASLRAAKPQAEA